MFTLIGLAENAGVDSLNDQASLWKGQERRKEESHSTTTRRMTNYIKLLPDNRLSCFLLIQGYIMQSIFLVHLSILFSLRCLIRWNGRSLQRARKQASIGLVNADEWIILSYAITEHFCEVCIGRWAAWTGRGRKWRVQGEREREKKVCWLCYRERKKIFTQLICPLMCICVMGFHSITFTILQLILFFFFFSLVLFKLLHVHRQLYFHSRWLQWWRNNPCTLGFTLIELMKRTARAAYKTGREEEEEEKAGMKVS